MLEIDGLWKSFGPRDVLRELTFSVDAGECLALVGPSGCGKTTLLRLVAGFEDADKGTIRLGGSTVSGPHVLVAPRQRGIGMVFQDLALWPHMTAGANVEFMVPRCVKGRGARQARADEALLSVGLSGRQRSYPGELSGGERQRLALARALASEPTLLLLDEPFSSLDAEVKGQMLELTREVQVARGVTAIYVTHVPDEVPGLAQRVARMSEGRIGETMTVGDFCTANGVGRR